MLRKNECVILSKCRVFRSVGEIVCVRERRGKCLAHVLVIWRGVCETMYICFLIFEPPPSLCALLFLILRSSCLLFPVRADVVTVFVYMVSVQPGMHSCSIYCTQRNLNMNKMSSHSVIVCPLVVLVHFSDVS